MVAIGEGGVHLVHGHGVHARHLVLLLPLHPTVLEPDLDLPLRQAKRMSDLDPEDEKLNFDFPQTGSGYWFWLLVTGSGYLRLRVRYRLKWNSFSSSRVW